MFSNQKLLVILLVASLTWCVSGCGSGSSSTAPAPVVDTAPPDYQLLVKKLRKSAPTPKFKGNWERRLRKYGDGLTIIYSAQCPHTIKIANDIAETARSDFHLEPRMVESKTHRDAQRAPTPYAVFSVIYNGRLLADHQISRARFLNLMRQVAE